MDINTFANTNLDLYISLRTYDLLPAFKNKLMLMGVEAFWIEKRKPVICF